MRPHDRFVALVQLSLTHHTMRVLLPGTWVEHMKILNEAMNIDPVALPNDVFQAAFAWMCWKTGTDKKPSWLVEFEENLATTVVLEQIEGTNHWWHTAEILIDGATVPDAWKKFVTGRDRYVRMTKKEADEFAKWASEVDGWDDNEPPFKVHTNGE
jgi:hypothetical protein